MIPSAASRLRGPNWDVALQAWADALVGQPYAWGRTDCVSLAIAAIGVLYPHQPALPGYPSKTAALRALAEDPVLIPRTLELLGATPTTRAFAQAGDILVSPAGADELALLVSLGAWALTGTPVAGVVRLPTLALPPETIAWRLPHG